MNFKKIGLMLAVTAITMAPLLSTVNAEDNSVGLRVSAVLPENQRSNDISYFDLLVKPKDQQTLVVNVVNTTNKPQTVNTAVSAATTNVNGVVEYAPSKNKLDQSAPIDMAKIATLPKSIEIPANSSKKLEVKLTIPDKNWDGVVAGGITVTQAEATQSSSNKKTGVTIRNRYAYAIGVLLQTKQDSTVTEKLNLAKVTADQIDARNAIISELHNTSETYLKKVSVTSKVTRVNSSKVLYEAKKSDMKVAPSSIFNYPINLKGHAFKAGRYTMDMTVKSEKSTWHFKKNFTITTKEANDLNAKDITIVHDEGFNWWWIVLIVAIILALGAYIWKRRRNQTNKN